MRDFMTGRWSKPGTQILGPRHSHNRRATSPGCCILHSVLENERFEVELVHDAIFLPDGAGPKQRSVALVTARAYYRRRQYMWCNIARWYLHSHVCNADVSERRATPSPMEKENNPSVAYTLFKGNITAIARCRPDASAKMP